MSTLIFNYQIKLNLYIIVSYYHITFIRLILYLTIERTRPLLPLRLTSPSPRRDNIALSPRRNLGYTARIPCHKK
jgi:hypothetical protein